MEPRTELNSARIRELLTVAMRQRGWAAAKRIDALVALDDLVEILGAEVERWSFAGGRHALRRLRELGRDTRLHKTLFTLVGVVVLDEKSVEKTIADDTSPPASFDGNKTSQPWHEVAETGANELPSHHDFAGRPSEWRSDNQTLVESGPKQLHVSGLGDSALAVEWSGFVSGTPLRSTLHKSLIIARHRYLTEVVLDMSDVTAISREDLNWLEHWFERLDDVGIKLLVLVRPEGSGPLAQLEKVLTRVDERHYGEGGCAIVEVDDRLQGLNYIQNRKRKDAAPLGLKER